MTDDIVWGLDGLDGNLNSLVTHRVGVWDLMIGGGPDVFIVTATDQEGDRVVNALSTAEPDNDEETVDLTVGDQAVDYPRKYVLTRDEVSAAIAGLAADRFEEGRWEIVDGSDAGTGDI